MFVFRKVFRTSRTGRRNSYSVKPYNFVKTNIKITRKRYISQKIVKWLEFWLEKYKKILAVSNESYAAVVFVTDHILELVYHKKVLTDVVNNSAWQKAISCSYCEGADHSQGRINDTKDQKTITMTWSTDYNKGLLRQLILNITHMLITSCIKKDLHLPPSSYHLNPTERIWNISKQESAAHNVSAVPPSLLKELHRRVWGGWHKKAQAKACDHVKTTEE